MDLIQHMTYWVKGELIQGRIMVGIGILFLIAMIFIFKSDNVFLRGTLIPLSFLLVVLLGYGGSMLYSRPMYLKQATEQYQSDPNAAHSQQLAKAEKDNKAYSNLKPVWAIIISICAILLIVFTSPYYKGVALGIIVTFSALFVVDATLHSRLKPYLEFLQGAG